MSFVRARAIRQIRYAPSAKYLTKENFQKIQTETTSAITTFNDWIREKAKSEKKYFLYDYTIDEQPIANFLFSNRRPEDWTYYHLYGKKLLDTLMAFGNTTFLSTQKQPKNSAPFDDLSKQLAEKIWIESMRLTLALFNDESYSEDYALLVVENLEAALNLMQNPENLEAMRRVVAAMENIHITITGNSFLHLVRSNKYAEKLKYLFEMSFIVLMHACLISAAVFLCTALFTQTPQVMTVAILSMLTSFFSGIGAIAAISLSYLFDNPKIIPHVEKINAYITELAKTANPETLKEANKRWYENLGKYVPSFFYAPKETVTKTPTPTPTI